MSTNAYSSAEPSISPSRRIWIRFKQDRRGYWSLVLFLILFVLSMGAELISNDRPLLARYNGQIMVPMAQESDQWIADVLTEVRSSWGNKGDAVTPDDVAKVRKATKNVMEPYTMETLMK